MAYQLGQTPVPVWATPNRKPIQVDLEALPNYLLKEEVFMSPDMMMEATPQYIQPSQDRRKTEPTVDPAMLDQYDLDKKWENRMDDDIAPSGVIINLDKLKDSVTKTFQSNPLVPILLRGTSSMYATITLGLAAAEYKQTKKEYYPIGGDMLQSYSPVSSTYFVIIMSTISIVYLWYALWDETFGQPLGLRRARSKMNSVAIDMALLCLMTSTVAVSFEQMISRDYICPAVQNRIVCRLHKGVISFSLVCVVTWFLTFLVSTFRMIDRASH